MSETKRTYEVIWADGRRPVVCQTYDEACDCVRARYSEAYIGHNGDLEDPGDRTLCWPDEEASLGDPGSNTCAEIRLADE
jgi:hypothetical protein